MYSFLMRAGSSYSELTAGLGYTDVQEREQLRAVFRRLPSGGGSVWAVFVANSGQTLLSLMEMYRTPLLAHDGHTRS